MATPDDLVVALRNAARDMTRRQSIRDLDLVLGQIVQAAVDTVPGVDAGGVSLTEHGAVTSRSPTHPAITKLDRRQSELNEGPCITALEDPDSDGVVLAQDLAGEDRERWPHFAPEAVEAGYRAMLSTQLSVEGGARAALNLYASRPHVYDTEARHTAGLFGVQAAVLLYGVEQARVLQRAVDSRDVIGQAKGILMERFTVDSDSAFQMLVRSSQDVNLKLVDVARWLCSQTAERAHPEAKTEN